MNSQKIRTYFSKPEKLLLGVGAAVAPKIGIPTLAIRITLLLITLLFIPIGILLYLILYLAFVSRQGKKLTFSLAGALLGIPFSYYFQPDMVKRWRGATGVFGYILNFPSIMEQYQQIVGNAWVLLGNILLSMLIFAFIGGAIGYYSEKNFNR